MKRERIRGKSPRKKPRLGIMPTMVQRNRTRYTRKAKHKHQRDDRFAMRKLIAKRLNRTRGGRGEHQENKKLG